MEWAVPRNYIVVNTFLDPEGGSQKATLVVVVVVVVGIFIFIHHKIERKYTLN